MNGWPVVSLGKFIAQRKSFNSIDDFTRYKRTRVQLHGKGIVLRDEVFGSEIKTKEQQAARAGEFLVAEIDAKVGGFGIVPSELNGAIVSSHYFLFEINEENCIPAWLGWFIRSGLLEEQVTARGSTNFAAIRPSHVLDFEIPLPPLDEQRRIVVHIEALAKRVKEAHSLKNQVDNQLTDLIVSLHLASSKETNIALRDILDLYEERVIVHRSDIYPQVGIKAYGQGMFFRESIHGTQTTYKYFNKMFEGAVVLSQVKGWEGAIAVCPSILVGQYSSPEYRTFRCKSNKCSHDYLSVLFSTSWFYSKLSTLSRGVGGRRERLRPENFLELEIPMPELKDQLRLLSVFSKIKQAHLLSTDIQHQLEIFTPSILDKAFKGEL